MINMKPTREQVVAEARTWINTPFKHQGRIKGVGADCLGVLYGVGKTFNIFDHDMTTAKALKYQGYTRSPRNNLIKQACDEYLTKIRHAELLPGDLILMTYVVGDPSHIAMYTGTTLIHALSQVKKCAEHSINEELRLKFTGFYRYPGLDNE